MLCVSDGVVLVINQRRLTTQNYPNFTCLFPFDLKSIDLSVFFKEFCKKASLDYGILTPSCKTKDYF